MNVHKRAMVDDLMFGKSRNLLFIQLNVRTSKLNTLTLNFRKLSKGNPASQAAKKEFPLSRRLYKYIKEKLPAYGRDRKTHGYGSTTT